MSWQHNCRLLSFLLCKLFWRPIQRTTAEVWDRTIWNCLETFRFYFGSAFRTENYAVINCGPASELFRYSRRPLPIQVPKTSSTSCAPRVPTIISILSIRSTSDNPICEVHDSPPKYDWHTDRAGGQSYYANGKWTGMSVSRVRFLFVHQGKCLAKVITLKSPSYHVSHYVEIAGDRCTHELVEAPTPRKAQTIAEWYYREWLKVNPSEQPKS